MPKKALAARLAQAFHGCDGAWYMFRSDRSMTHAGDNRRPSDARRRRPGDDPHEPAGHRVTRDDPLTIHDRKSNSSDA